MMTNKRYFLGVLLVLLLVSCSHKQWVVVHIENKKIAMDSTKEKDKSREMTAFILPIKQELDEKMNVVIGHSKQLMTAKRPESLLSNFSADTYREVATEYLGSNVSIGVVNFGGIRSTLPKGEITVRNIFQLMPFENELVILWLSGEELSNLLQIFAKERGQGVSGISMEIKDEKAEKIKIDGVPLDRNKIYTIATNDFLAEGNDRMTPLAYCTKRVNTHIKIRDMFMAYIIKKEKKGEVIEAQLDGRIKIIE